MSSRPNFRLVRWLTIGSDVVLVNLAFFCAYVVRYQLEWIRPVTFYEPYVDYLPQQGLLTLLIIGAFAQTRVWTRRRGEYIIDEIGRAAYASAAAIAVMVMATFFLQPVPFSRLLLVWAYLFLVLFIAMARLLRRLVLSVLYQRGVGVEHVLVVGSGEVGRSVIRTLLARPELGYRAVGYLTDGFSQNHLGSGRIPHLGEHTDLVRVLRERPEVGTVFISLPARMHEQSARLTRQAHQHGRQTLIVPDLFELSLSRVAFANMAGLPVFSVRDLRLSRVSMLLKRVLDLLIILLLLPLGLLLTALAAILIRLDSPGPIFFVQTRIGKDGRPFQMVKFRSMVQDAEARKAGLLELNDATGPIFKIKKDPRLTRAGRLIRRLSLDELPQFYNVLRGEMSLVGPRPPLPEEVAQYQPWHMQRLGVKGGITGLWQVSGRSDLTFDEQCLLDIYYIENWSVLFDVRIMIQTIPFMLFGRGAY